MAVTAPKIALLLASLLLCGAATAQRRGRSLVRQLRSQAEARDLSLVYSPGIVPDTVIARRDYPGALDSLTAPFGLAYAIVGSQLVVSRRRVRPYSVGGYLEDVTTGERLVGATVVVTGQGRGAVTNAYGYFVVPDVVPGDSLDYRYVGYPPDRRAVPGPELPAEEVVIRLRPTLRLGVVEVIASSTPEAPVLAGTSSPQPAEVLERSELLAGDRDVNTFLGLIPGVQSAPSGFGGYGVRGADPSQNLVLLDDATLYLPSHAAGLVSSVPGNAVRSLQLHKNGGPARYGDRVGAVLDLRLKEGSRTGHQLSGNAGLSDLGVAAEGPLGAGSYFVSGRHSITDVWIGALRELEVGDVPDVGVDYYDASAKVNVPLAAGHRVYGSVFVGRDRYRDRAASSFRDELGVTSYDDASERDAVNAIVSLRHAAPFGSRWFVNTTLTLSQFRYVADDVLRITELSPGRDPAYTFAEDLFRTGLLDLGLRQDHAYALNASTRFAFGVDMVSHRFRVGTSTESGTRLPTPDSTIAFGPAEDSLPQLQSYDVSAYGSAIYEPTERLRVEGGLRLATQLGLRRSFASLLPRLSVSYELSDRQGLDASFGVTRQFIHRVSTRNPGLPRELYVPTIGRLRPQGSRYLTAGWRYADAEGRAVSVGAYRQTLRDLARFDGPFEGRGLSNWTGNVRRGTGWASGLELEAVYPLGASVLAATYTLARSERSFEDEFGDPLPPERFRLDRRHSATLTATRRFGGRWEASATMRVGSGLPVQLPDISPNAPVVPAAAVPLTNTYEYGDVEAVLPAFHSLDLGGRYRFEAVGAAWRLAFGLQNAYLNSNPVFVSLQAIPDPEAGAVSVRYAQVSLLPTLPFARLSATFKHAPRPPDSDPRGSRRPRRL